MKRVWKPLDVGGLRLYEVQASWDKIGGGRWHEKYVVAAMAPRHAAALISRIYDGCHGRPNFSAAGRPLNILMPETWWKDGVPCLVCNEREAHASNKQ